MRGDGGGALREPGGGCGVSATRRGEGVWTAIVNPVAGGGRGAGRAREALYALREAGLRVAAVETRYPGHARELAREAFHAGARRLLVLGGDGTFGEVATGLLPAAEGHGLALGLVPTGTGNSLLRDFGIKTADDALRGILGGGRRPLDAVRATHKDGELHFVNLLAIGFPARAGALTNARLKPLGALGYALAVAIATARLDHPVFPLALDGRPGLDARPATLISFSNSRFTGGAMMMAPDADPGDGALDVIRMGPLGRGELLRAFPRIFRGTHREMAVYEHARVRRVDLELAGPVDAMVDGEVYPLHLEALEVRPRALEVLA